MNGRTETQLELAIQCAAFLLLILAVVILVPLMGPPTP